MEQITFPTVNQDCGNSHLRATNMRTFDSCQTYHLTVEMDGDGRLGSGKMMISPCGLRHNEQSWFDFLVTPLFLYNHTYTTLTTPIFNMNWMQVKYNSFYKRGFGSTTCHMPLSNPPSVFVATLQCIPSDGAAPIAWWITPPLSPPPLGMVPSTSHPARGVTMDKKQRSRK